MKARIVSNAITTGSIARDYIRSAQGLEHSTPSSTRLQAQAARAILESFQEPDEYLAIEATPPIKRLVAVLTEGLQAIRGLRREDGRVAAEMLFRGCHVRLIGIPERYFVVRDIFWDYQEVRIREPRTKIDYVVPWDCLVFRDEQER
jgi:hypothetical protein